MVLLKTVDSEGSLGNQNLFFYGIAVNNPLFKHLYFYSDGVLLQCLCKVLYVSLCMCVLAFEDLLCSVSQPL